MKDFLNKFISTKTGFFVIGILSGAFLAFAIIYGGKVPSVSLPTFPTISFPPGIFAPDAKDIKKFSSEEEFKTYLQESETGYYGGFAMGRGG